MADAGLAVVSFVPKISKVDAENSSSYLTAFAQEKTPLQKLFEGEKLFLAQPPIAPHVQFLKFPAQVTMMEEMGSGDHPNRDDQQRFEQAGGDPHFQVTAHDEGRGVRARRPR